MAKATGKLAAKEPTTAFRCITCKVGHLLCNSCALAWKPGKQYYCLGCCSCDKPGPGIEPTYDTTKEEND